MTVKKVMKAWAVVGKWRGKWNVILSTINYRKAHAEHEMKNVVVPEARVIQVEIIPARKRRRKR